ALEEAAPLTLVHAVDGLEDVEAGIVVAGGADDGADVLGKAGPAVPDAGEEELVSDARVGADALADLIHVGADRLAERGDLVDEGDLGREERVRGVLGHL